MKGTTWLICFKQISSGSLWLLSNHKAPHTPLLKRLKYMKTSVCNHHKDCKPTEENTNMTAHLFRTTKDN